MITKHSQEARCTLRGTLNEHSLSTIQERISSSDDHIQYSNSKKTHYCGRHIAFYAFEAPVLRSVDPVHIVNYILERDPLELVLNENRGETTSLSLTTNST